MALQVFPPPSKRIVTVQVPGTGCHRLYKFWGDCTAEQSAFRARRCAQSSESAAVSPDHPLTTLADVYQAGVTCADWQPQEPDPAWLAALQPLVSSKALSKGMLRGKPPCCLRIPCFTPLLQAMGSTDVQGNVEALGRLYATAVACATRAENPGLAFISPGTLGVVKDTNGESVVILTDVRHLAETPRRPAQPLPALSSSLDAIDSACTPPWHPHAAGLQSGVAEELAAVASALVKRTSLSPVQQDALAWRCSAAIMALSCKVDSDDRSASAVYSMHAAWLLALLETQGGHTQALLQAVQAPLQALAELATTLADADPMVVVHEDEAFVLLRPALDLDALIHAGPEVETPTYLPWSKPQDTMLFYTIEFAQRMLRLDTRTDWLRRVVAVPKPVQGAKRQPVPWSTALFSSSGLESHTWYAVQVTRCGMPMASNPGKAALLRTPRPMDWYVPAQNLLQEVSLEQTILAVGNRLLVDRTLNQLTLLPTKETLQQQSSAMDSGVLKGAVGNMALMMSMGPNAAALRDVVAALKHDDLMDGLDAWENIITDDSEDDTNTPLACRVAKHVAPRLSVAFVFLVTFVPALAKVPTHFKRYLRVVMAATADLVHAVQTVHETLQKDSSSSSSSAADASSPTIKFAVHGDAATPYVVLSSNNEDALLVTPALAPLGTSDSTAPRPGTSYSKVYLSESRWRKERQVMDTLPPRGWAMRQATTSEGARPPRRLDSHGFGVDATTLLGLQARLADFLNEFMEHKKHAPGDARFQRGGSLYVQYIMLTAPRVWVTDVVFATQGSEDFSGPGPLFSLHTPLLLPMWHALCRAIDGFANLGLAKFDWRAGSLWSSKKHTYVVDYTCLRPLDALNKGTVTLPDPGDPECHFAEAMPFFSNKHRRHLLALLTRANEMPVPAHASPVLQNTHHAVQAFAAVAREELTQTVPRHAKTSAREAKALQCFAGAVAVLQVAVQRLQTYLGAQASVEAEASAKEEDLFRTVTECTRELSTALAVLQVKAKAPSAPVAFAAFAAPAAPATAAMTTRPAATLLAHIKTQWAAVPSNLRSIPLDPELDPGQ